MGILVGTKRQHAGYLVMLKEKRLRHHVTLPLTFYAGGKTRRHQSESMSNFRRLPACDGKGSATD